MNEARIWWDTWIFGVTEKKRNVIQAQVFHQTTVQRSFSSDYNPKRSFDMSTQAHSQQATLKGPDREKKHSFTVSWFQGAQETKLLPQLE